MARGPQRHGGGSQWGRFFFGSPQRALATFAGCTLVFAGIRPDIAAIFINNVFNIVVPLAIIVIGFLVILHPFRKKKGKGDH